MHLSLARSLVDNSKHDEAKSARSNRSNRSAYSNRSRISKRGNSARQKSRKKAPKKPEISPPESTFMTCGHNCKTGQMRGSKLPKFTWNELKDIKVIRRINKDQYKELGHLLNDGKGNIPIFGYPLVCYSPNSNPQDLNKIFRPEPQELYDPKEHSLWLILSSDIFSSLKPGHQLQIKELLDKHDDLEENFNDLLRKFAKGNSLVTKE